MSIRERLLENPNVFALFNALIGVKSRTKTIIEDYVSPQEGEVLVDIACGRGEFSKELNSTQYIGVDNNPLYIRYANKHYADYGSFFCCDVSELGSSLQGKRVDTALLIGVLHHLTNSQAKNMIRDISHYLSDGGKIVSVDPVFTPEQGLVSRLLEASDRGKFVRSIEEHRSLFDHAAEISHAEIREDWLRIPYTHYVCVSRKLH